MANFLTTYGLIAIGGCLILGFLTPLAAICAAAFLAMLYFSIPPWPGLPPNPKTEGHYWIVSKNLVELIACLLIAVTASGHWFGLDALFFRCRAADAAGRRMIASWRRSTASQSTARPLQSILWNRSDVEPDPDLDSYRSDRSEE